MKIAFEIAKNENREPYLLQTWKGDTLESERTAKILAYYDVKILNTGKVSVFDFTELENEKGEMLDHDDTLYDHLNELDLAKGKIEELTGLIIEKVESMYFNQSKPERLRFEIEIS